MRRRHERQPADVAAARQLDHARSAPAGSHQQDDEDIQEPAALSAGYSLHTERRRAESACWRLRLRMVAAACGTCLWQPSGAT